MPLSLNEIRNRAIDFSNEWKDVSSERAEAKSFWDGFFNVFGISRRRVASFEEPVKKPDGQQGYIDLLWKGNVLVEHKSKGRDLESAYQQAKNYFPGLQDQELPRFIVVSDFDRFKVYDLDIKKETEFQLKELYKNISLFGFISGYQQRTYKEEEPVNIKAAELMGELHDSLKANGYEGHELEVLLVRLLFCLFAEDTTVFEKFQFTEYIEKRTGVDGSDLGLHLGQLFDVLNTATEKRQKNLDDHLAAFPYLNGALYAKQLHFAAFNSAMRNRLLKCCYFDWSVISPAIFGSMFQSVMNEKLRRHLGAHYTSEKNILKVIKGLFLDELYTEFEKAKGVRSKLEKLQIKIGGLKFLDPACGCGNFLIITYRELRLLEIEILKILLKGQTVTDVAHLSKIDVDAFYGIEFEEFPAQIAQVAMWLIDHQMNMRLSMEFGEYYKRLPLKKSATIVCGNALRIDWQSLLNPLNTIDVVAGHANIYLVDEPQEEYKAVNIKAKSYQVHQRDKQAISSQTKFDYLLGNPPFVGKNLMSQEQASDMDFVFQGIKNYGLLDYVTAWYLKAARYIAQTPTRVAFVSTNSISQGEQVSVLWNELIKNKVKILFAHRTFKWSNEAKGNAAVFVVIIGFQYVTDKDALLEKHLYDYPDVKGEPQMLTTQNINPYLVSAVDTLVQSKSKPISQVPEIIFGSMPNDDGNFLFTDQEKDYLVKIEPNAKKYIKPLLSAREFLNGENRWCLWLKDANPADLRRLTHVMARVDAVKKFRLNSLRDATRKLAQFPSLFGEIRQPESNYILIPRHSSENRKYIPFGFFDENSIVSDSCLAIPKTTLFHFGILQSEMHMIWVKYVCGRIKSDYRYSNNLVYNNFPWPENLPKQKNNGVGKLAQQILKVRERYKQNSLADLYDPLAMPVDLVKAHQELDKFVDSCYRSQPFNGEMQRIEFLFELYKKYTQPLFGTEKKIKKKRPVAA